MPHLWDPQEEPLLQTNPFLRVTRAVPPGLVQPQRWLSPQPSGGLSPRGSCGPGASFSLPGSTPWKAGKDGVSLGLRRWEKGKGAPGTEGQTLA